MKNIRRKIVKSMMALSLCVSIFSSNVFAIEKNEDSEFIDVTDFFDEDSFVETDVVQSHYKQVGPYYFTRDGNNQLTMKASYVTENGTAFGDDFDKLFINKNEQVINVTLKQLNLIWKPVSETEGKFQETYEGYSGHVVTLNLKGEKDTSLNKIAYGKYEIIIDDVQNFTIKDITELSTKDVIFSFEDGKYYVTYSYETLEARESLSVNMLIDNWKGYTKQQKISNFFTP